MHSPSGQTAIRLRELLVRGDASGAAELVVELDRDHRIEVLLGAALRDAADDHEAARRFLAAETTGLLDAATWSPVCERLTCTGDDALDALAAAWVAAGALPDRWDPAGRVLTSEEGADLLGASEPDEMLVELSRDGVSGEALLAAFAGFPLHRAVTLYYTGGIRALGWRPLLVLALSSAIAPRGAAAPA